MEQNEKIEVEIVRVERETAKARLFILAKGEGIEVYQWIPKSQHTVDRDGILEVAKWFVDKENFGGDNGVRTSNN